jgi:aspartate kinase/aspartokinase/homoserine dehydrogenase 1
MSKIVVKFGGSNLKSKSDINKIIEVIKSYNQDLIIVVSALFGVTDKLNILSQNSCNSKQIIYEIIQQYIDITNNNDKTILAKISNKKNELKQFIEELKQIPNSVIIQNNILSFGEKLSSYILNIILSNNNITCKEALPENINLLTNGNLKAASINQHFNIEDVKKHFEEKTSYIVPGFYGISPKGNIALFGRGGSDYTASILASATNAKSLDLWKDVSGFLSADPKIVKNPLQLKSLTYLEAAELSYFGAKIIHPDTIRPLLKNNIPLNILDITSDISTSKSGTKINGEQEKTEQVIKSITYNNSFVLLKLKGSGVGIRKGILHEITNLFDTQNINIRSVITSQIEIDFLLHKDDLQKASDLAKTIQDNNYDIEIEDNISLIASVGNGIKQSPGIAGKVFGALSEKNINIKHIIFGASDVAIYLIVAQNDLNLAINQIHNQIFNN